MTCKVEYIDATDSHHGYVTCRLCGAMWDRFSKPSASACLDAKAKWHHEQATDASAIWSPGASTGAAPGPAPNMWVGNPRPAETELRISETGGVKASIGKRPLHLLPRDAIEAVADVLALGAEKYTKRFVVKDSEAEAWLNEYLAAVLLQHAIQADVYTQIRYVEAATKNSSVNKTQTSQNDKGKTDYAGANTTSTSSKSMQKSDCKTQLPGSETQKQKDYIRIRNVEHLNQKLSNCESSNITNAVSAKEICRTSPVRILITVTQAESPEAYYAVDATTVSECLKRALLCCLEHLNISKRHPLPDFVRKNETTEITITGARNWERGLSVSDLVRAADGHLWDWFLRRNDGRDPQFGTSHLAHAACCVLFLLAHELRGLPDDRPPAVPEVPQPTKDG